jgi:hypothetical protein
MNPSAQSETKGWSRTHASSSGFFHVSILDFHLVAACSTPTTAMPTYIATLSPIFIFFDQRRRRRIPRPRVRNNLPFSVDLEIQVHDRTSTGSLILRTHDNAHFGDVHLLRHNTISNPFSAFRRSFLVHSPGVCSNVN